MRRLAVLVTIAVALATLTVTLVASPTVAGASARQLHLAPGGSDTGNGTPGAPFATFARALSALSPGDTLVVHGGDYVERVRNPSIRPGTPTAPIRVVAAPGENPVLHGLLWLKGASWWTLEGLEVTWSEANTSTEHMVKMSDGVGWRITASTFRGARSYAGLLIAGEPSGYRVDHNVIRDTHPSNGTNQDHLVYVNAGAGGGVIEHNVLANSPNGRGIKIGTSSPSALPMGNVVIRNNTFFDNRGPSNIQLSYGASGNLIERNVLVRPGAGRAAVTAYDLIGAGNVVRDNVVADAVAAVEHHPGIHDGGNIVAGSVLVDPAGGDFGVVAPFGGYGAAGAGRVAAGPVDPASAGGYRMLASDGGIFTFGDAAFHGSTGDLRLNQPIVGGASSPGGDGYWLVARDGGVFTFGDAAFHGSTGDLRLNQPIVGLAPTPTGGGYWLVARDGGVFAFGDAAFQGSAAGRTTSVVTMAPTSTGNGYWITASDGQVFAFGDAPDLGRAAALNAPIVAMAPTPSGGGYLLVGRDGGLFTFGDAAFHGSTGDLRLNQPIVGVSLTAGGYRLVAADGGVFTFGDAAFLGSTGSMRLNSPIIAFV